MKLSGSFDRQVEQEFPVHDLPAHVANIGHMVEVRPCLNLSPVIGSHLS